MSGYCGTRRLAAGSTGLLFVLTVVLVAASTRCGGGAPEFEEVQEGDLDTLDERATYALGHDLGRNLREQGVDVELEQLVRGILDGLQDRRPLLTDGEMHDALLEFRDTLSERRQERMEERGRTNRELCAELLADNRRRPGVVATASGLQYEVLDEGDGPTPGPTDEVRAHYEGTLPDGTVFNTTYPVGEPARMQVNGVIPGWQEALPLMREGARWRLWLPADLAYGDEPPGPTIGPDACLTFEVELVEVIGR